MKKIHVGIIIVNWNGYHDTTLLLNSLQKLQTIYQHTIYLVDNASTDTSKQKFSTNSTIHFISLSENKGFSGANNEAIIQGLEDKIDYFWILNNDTIVDPKAMDMLILPFIEDEDVGMTVSKIYFMKGHEYHDRYEEKDKGNVLWYAGGIIDWNNMYGSHRGVDEIDTGQYDSTEETAFATGCSMVISRKVLEDVGTFDHRYFAYLEDMDFSMRIKKSGYKIMYVPMSKVWHKNAGSTARPGNNLQQYYMTRNRLLFGMTYASIRTKFALFREAMRYLLIGRSVEKQAVWDWLKGKWGKQFIWNQSL